MFKNTSVKLSTVRKAGEDLARDLLRKYDKVATSFTLDSIEGVIREDGNRCIELEFSADKSWRFINDGRPAGAKMPPSVFSPDGRRLRLWFDAVDIPLSADFPVRRHIAEEGIEPVPITDEFEREFQKIFERLIVDALAVDIADLGFELIQNT